ncbi:MAG: aminotransferase, partial [Gammaproteobacteria bacterium]|nr:aminotransferase [Gammaproteobacteria bacterium]
EHAWYKCYVFVRQEGLNEGWTRDRIMAEVSAQGVPCYSGTCSEVYLEKAFDDTGYQPTERLPVAKALGENSLLFLVHPTLTEDEIKKTCDVIMKIMHQASI